MSKAVIGKYYSTIEEAKKYIETLPEFQRKLAVIIAHSSGYLVTLTLGGAENE